MASLSGPVALVTGGSRGIGAAIARRLAADGTHVALAYRTSVDAAQRVVDELREHGVEAEAFQADVADATAAADLIDRVVERFGRLDVLVNNAGVYLTGPVTETPDADFDQTIDTNVRAVFAAVRQAASVLSEGGRIITIGSVVAHKGFPGASVYGASKAAVSALTRSWAREFGPQGITVNVIDPGPIDTDMNPADPAKNPGAEMMASATALGRYGQAEEVASAVAFLASPEASYITGASIPVDGGIAA